MNVDLVLKATKVDGVYTADPKKHADAKRYKKLTFDEAIFKNLVTVPQLIDYIREVKRRVPGIPVSTAEPFDIWLKHPELLKEVDFVAVHILPFWNGIPVQDAVPWTMGNYQAVKNELKERGIDKRIVLTEVGWPSQGLQRMGAVASPVNQGIFLRNFVREAKKQDIE